jgi:hypothetical protein
LAGGFSRLRHSAGVGVDYGVDVSTHFCQELLMAAAPPKREDSHPSAHNLAARMARWSSRHRKKAFWGWLAFVILAFAIGLSMGSNLISDVDNFNGESHDAEAALEDAGLRPQSEVVFIQSDKLTVKDPQFKAAVQDVTSHLRKVA